ncbi:hypothetical protein [Paenibacillus tengchongensis]|uniref:hypothetical protein n=1 Tax=Paenibacillus tengchongensis TaxID=2608684 RepID=UPI00124E7B30|nr:hypothetical protein [Paenibacillus tengchongensis]
MRPTLHKHEFQVFVITKGDVLRFFVIEIIIGTVTYSLAMKLVHNVVLASAGGWAWTEGMKRLGLKELFGK